MEGGTVVKTLMDLFGVEERAEPMPKQIKGTKPAVKDIRKPACPTHQRDMEYEPSIGRWKCPEAACQFTATRKVKDEDAPAPKPPVRKLAAPRKSTPVYQSELSLSIWTDPTSGEDEYLLNTTLNGEPVSLRVTDHVETVIDDQTNSVTLCLLFHDVQRK